MPKLGTTTWDRALARRMYDEGRTLQGYRRAGRRRSIADQSVRLAALAAARQGLGLSARPVEARCCQAKTGRAFNVAAVAVAALNIPLARGLLGARLGVGVRQFCRLQF
jgi:hypothetical protein